MNAPAPESTPRFQHWIVSRGSSSPDYPGRYRDEVAVVDIAETAEGKWTATAFWSIRSDQGRVREGLLTEEIYQADDQTAIFRIVHRHHNELEALALARFERL